MARERLAVLEARIAVQTEARDRLRTALGRLDSTDRPDRPDRRDRLDRPDQIVDASITKR
ncbi:hypothetical protein [Streptomyces sp. NPDC048269]|uniref:hypothetical protein n=1 Tax=Streptomyces sp. NPDC048269 TaxID=3155753 RepID=UPI00341B4636